MSKKKDPPQLSPLGKLQDLADNLQSAYKKAGDKLAKMVGPLDAAVKMIGVTFSPKGRETVFATDDLDGGWVRVYALAAARGKNREAGLYVRVRDYPPGDDCDEEDVRSQMLKPDAIPLPVRVKILDFLDSFAMAYEKHVRKTRKNLLEESEGSGSES